MDFLEKFDVECSPVLHTPLTVLSFPAVALFMPK